MKKFFTLIFFQALSSQLIWSITAVAPGVYSLDNTYYEIKTAENLYWISQNSSSWSNKFIQTADIDLAGVTWTPIGNNTTKFSGTYDGNGYRIIGLAISSIATYSGFFGVVNGTIENVWIENATLNANAYSTQGILVGLISNGNIQNCYTSGEIYGTAANYGGIAGSLNQGTITSCFTSANVTSTSISTTSAVGGCVGITSNGTITNCYATGSVLHAVGIAGGFTGTINNASVISNCYSIGSVTGNTKGGFVGKYFTGTFTDCFFDETTSGLTNSYGAYNTIAPSGITAKTTLQMQSISTFSSWKTSNWSLVEGSYPKLLWQLPTVKTISPASGITGTSVLITGTNFTGATSVKFGSTAATSYAVNSSTSITATAPSGSGTVDVTVTTSDGTSATSSNDQFTYVAVPSISSISPTSGPTSGTTSVTITGTNFTGATAVKFGSTNATGYTVNSNTQITATVPAGSAGTVDVTVTTTGGTSATGSSDQFTYVAAPSISSMSPTSGPTTGTTSVTITGTNLSGATAVKFGSTNATGYTVNSNTQITATVPAGSAGTVDLTVTTAGGTSATGSSDQFTYVDAPSISSISPTSGPTTGTTSITITGTNLSGATAVKFGSTNATGYTVNSSTQITATAPAGSAGTVDLTVTTAGGTSATGSSDQFTYVDAPSISSISPTSGPTTGTTSITITGINLSGATAVKFGSTNATGYTVNSNTQITATAPAGSAGTVDITVTTTGGTSATSSSDQFTYVAAPTVTSISPASGPLAGGRSVTITGTNLSGATEVKFGTSTASITSNMSTQIVVTAPAGSEGSVHITVTTTGGISTTSDNDKFTYSTTTGIDDAKLDGVTIYPNPVDDRLYIKGVDEGEIAVYDMGGCKVIAAILANAQAVDVSGLAKGVYTVRITTPNGKVEKKLVKK